MTLEILHRLRQSWNRYRARVRLVSILSCLAVGIALFAAVYSIPAGLLLSALFVPALLLVGERAAEWGGNKADGVARELEQVVYGQRVLVVDSAEEFRRKGVMPEAVSAVEMELKFHPAALDFLAHNRKTLLQQAFILGLLTVLTIAMLGWSLPRAAHKVYRIQEYYRETVNWNIPDYYIEGRPLEIDLSGELGQFDRAVLVLSNRELVPVAGKYTLETETAQKSLTLSLVTFKYGLRRVQLTKTLYATTRLLPNRIRMRVIYPFRQEEYSGLQDVEMWVGGRIELEGNLTKELSRVELKPAGQAEINWNKNSFDLRFRPATGGKHALHFTSVDNDSFVTPDFTVALRPNQAPVARLLFPLRDVLLGHYQWSVTSVVEGEDDQGLDVLSGYILITNKDPRLTIRTEKHFRVPLSGERVVRQSTVIKYTDVEILPGDVANVIFRVRDLFGIYSAPVGFRIISPDLDELIRQRERLQQELRKEIGQLTNRYREYSKDLQNQNLSGAHQKSREIDSSVSNINEKVSELSRSFSGDEQNVEEIRQSLQRMREITETLRQNSDTIKQLTQLMEKNPQAYKELQLDRLKMSESLEELNSLLKNLEHYRKITDLLTQFNVVQRAYEGMKEQKNREMFERAKESYQKQLEKLASMGQDKVRELAQELRKESEKIKMGNEDSYRESDKLMKQLREELQSQITRAGQERLKQKMQQIDRIIEELYLDVAVLDETLDIDWGGTENLHLDNFNRVVENVNSVNVSIKKAREEILAVLEGLVFAGNARQEMVNLLEKNNEVMDYALTGLRDKNQSSARSGLNMSANLTGLLAVYLMKVNQSLNQQMQQMQQGQQGQPQMMSLGLGDLMRMQASISQGLEELMRRMEQSGQMTPEMRQMMDEMRKLQQEILKNFGEMMSRGGEGLFSGGEETGKMMEDIIKDLESYKIGSDSLSKSKKIEEKLLNSQKSIQSKGISEKRKAEAAKFYEVTPPEKNILEQPEKVDLDKLGGRGVSHYYKELIRRYREKK